MQRCPYCDFNSHPLSAAEARDGYGEALWRDLQWQLTHYSARPIHSIFIGGGTPSLMEPTTLAGLMAHIRGYLPLAAGAEITMEANPGTTEQQRFHDYRQAGVTRLSLGVQSFAPQSLQVLGRIHSAAEAEQAARQARMAGFQQLNLDLMFGLPGQGVEAALYDLQRAIALEPDHISWYQLTIEPHTPFYTRPPTALPDDDLIAEIQQQGIELLAAHGYQRYEISAYARPGARCAHNLNYWQFGDYLGIGAGSHSKLTTASAAGLTIERVSRLRHPQRYIEQAGRPGVRATTEPSTPEGLVLEFMMNGLRLVEGVTMALFEARTGLSRTLLLSGVQQAVSQGLLRIDGDRMVPTPQGLLFLNQLLEIFVDG